MEILKLLKERHAVRSYTNEKITKSIKEELEKTIATCNKEGNLNIKLMLNEPKAFNTFMAHYGKFNNVNNYIVLIGKNAPDLEEKCGYYGEKIVLKAQELGLNTCFVALTYGKNKIPYKLATNEKLVCSIAIGYGLTKGVSHKIKTFEDVSKSINNVPEWYKRGIEYALLAPTAVNQQKFCFELLPNNKVKALPGTGFYTKVDLGIVKYNFELGAGTNNFSWENNR
jgi:hypothetical protein